MQRVSTELHAALSSRDDVEYSSLVLRSSWQWTHVKTGPFLLRALFEIRRVVQRGEVDVVLFSSMVTASLAALLKPLLERNGVYAAAIVHGRDVTMDLAPYQTLVPHIFDALDAVLPVSRATGDACIARGLHSDKVYVIPNGVSVGRFGTTPSKKDVRAELLHRFGNGRPVPDRGLLLCSVGRQVKRKGFAWFIENVLPLLPEDVHYWLAGDGPEADEIAAAARAGNARDRVKLLGRVSEEDLQLLYRGADLFVMPNIPVPGDMEGFGVVMLEAGVCGLPTIASSLEGITDVIEEGENGHLVSSGNAWEFSEAVMRYYHEHDALEAARSRAARYVERHFSWHAVAQKYVDIMESVIEPAFMPEAVPA